MKKVSVIIPTYNRPRELMQSIKTVLDQTYEGDIEVIIVDDSKESQEEEIKEEFSGMLNKSRNRHINYIHKAKKEGSPLARNIGIKEAKGEYIAFLDDDDVWLPKKLELQVKVLNKFKHVGLCVCWMLDKRFGQERVNKTPEVINYEHVLKTFNVQSTSAYLFRSYQLKLLGGFDTSLASAQEYDLAIRISKQHPIISIPKVLVIQNATPGQISENWKKKIQGILDIYRKYHTDYPLMNHVKVLSILTLYLSAHILGNRIHKFIVPFKERYV